MPINGPASYIPTTEEFLNHWASVNAALGAAGPLVIPGAPLGFATPISRATLQGLFTALEGQHATVQTAITDADLAGEDVRDLKGRLLDKLNQFNDKVRGLLPGTKWERRLPLVPSIGDGRAKIMEPLETALNLWVRIDADGALEGGALLILRDNYPQGDFEADLTDLRAAYRTAGQKDDALGLEREERNDLQEKIYPILRQYRVLMPTFFAPSDALVAELPLLTPTGSRTPDPVAATATWDAAGAKAQIEWTASTDPELDHYEVRWSPGTEYHADEESTLGTVLPIAARLFLTDQGLAAPGDQALYRVVVVLKTGNEAGSAPVTVTRP